MSEKPKAAILVVDDHEPALYARSRVLERGGYTVLRASSGMETLALAEQARPDVIVLDVNLPDMNGVEVCRRLRQHPATAGVPILHVTASGLGTESHVLALEAGTDTYLVEPLDPGVLLATIQALLRMRAAEVSLRKANSELERSNQDLQEFAYIASHDLKEPLRTVRAYSQLLSRRFGSQLGDEGAEYIDFIVNATSHMYHLIEDLLVYSRVGSERETAPVAMEEVLATVITNLKEAVESSGAAITNGPLPTVLGSRDQLEQLLQNLVDNAIKYRRPDVAPVVHVAAEAENGAWRFSVEDNGMGFEQKYADQIFRMFQRLNGGTSGTGIGLAIARKVAEAHGGRIWATSEPGVGSTFFFTIATR